MSSSKVGMESLSQRSQAYGHHKLIISIDLATTRCCVASGHQILSPDNEQLQLEVTPYSGWISYYETGKKWPLTCLYYGSQRLPTTGHALEPIFRNPLPKMFKVDRFFRLWKLLFHDHQNDPMTKEIQEQLQEQLHRLGKSALSLLHDWVELIYNEILVQGDDSLWSLRGSYDKFRPQDLEIIVTVPPGRSVIAHEQVPEAFAQVPIGTQQVFLVSEPEAMFRSWVHDGAHADDFQVNRRYLVADGGGGTCCFVRFRLDRLEPLGFAQEFESESITCGAETISTSFQKLAATKVPADYLDRDWALDTLRREFDEYYKLYFDFDDEQKGFAFKMPGGRPGLLEFSYQEIAECFDRCIERLIKGIERQKTRGHKVDYLVLGGGLFSSPYVMKSIRREFGSMTIRELSADKGHVARGAVLVRACAGGDFITTRPIIRSKGVVTWIEVTDNVRSSPIFPYLDLRGSKHDNRNYFYAVQWLAKRGDDAVDMHEIASEATFETARRRLFDLDTKDLEFSEKIVTVSYSPGDAQWAAFRSDGKLMDQAGNLIPDPDEAEFITWNPGLVGIETRDLEVKRPKRGQSHRELRYSILMQLKEVSTKYWIKAWSLQRPKVGRGKPEPKASLSSPTEREALFTCQEISKSLSESFKLGKGLSKDAGVKEDALDLARERLQLRREAASSRKPSAPSLPPRSSDHTIQSAEKSTTASNMSDAKHSNSAQPVPISSLGEYVSVQTSSIAQRTPAQGRPTLGALHSSTNPHREIGLSPRPSTEKKIECGVGARRINGGCWTCDFRHVKCGNVTPQCTECSNLGLVCEYGRPHWFYDDKLKEAQKEINQGLITKHKIRTGNRAPRSARSGVSSPAPAGPSANSFVPVNRTENSIIAAVTKPRQTTWLEPPVVALVGNYPEKLPLPNEAQQVGVSPQAKRVQDENDDLYNGPTSPKKKQRTAPNPESFREPAPDRNTTTEPRKRRSRREKTRSSLPANMVLWEDVDDEEFELGV